MSSIAHRRVSIRNPYGLHLRLADRIVHLAEQFRAEVWVSHRGRAADGKSILDLLGLAAAGGNRLELEARGPDAEGAVAALADLIATWSPEDLVDERTGSPRRPISRPGVGRQRLIIAPAGALRLDLRQA